MLNPFKRIAEDVVCHYCHQLRSYNHTAMPARPDTTKILQRHLRGHPNTIAVLVVDAADIPASLVSRGIPELTGTKGIIVALNKVDLFSQFTTYSQEQSIEKMISWIKKRIQNDLGHVAEANNVPVEVIPISARTGDGVFNLIDAINRQRVDSSYDVCFIGRPNAGKSLLINAITRLANGTDPEKSSTASIYPGTTVGVISRPLSSFGVLFQHPSTSTSVDQQYNPPTTPPTTPETKPHTPIPSLHDTPGLFSTNISQITSLLTPVELKQTIATKPFPKYQKQIPLPTGKSLFLGALVRIDMVVGTHDFRSRPMARVFASNLIPLHPCRTSRSAALFANVGKLKDILNPPSSQKRVQELGGKLELAARIQMSNSPEYWKGKGGSFDVAVGGIGWVQLKGVPENGIVEVWSLAAGAGVVVRDSFVVV
ncbi:UNVERIFIED_CONTAM: hypothetical protein HDU68_001940 [Siphonaria sp. JEL0065]|nr:hypothetical protein HDU68_001940 [Siphonaria sp. JEL0065]